jgi:hypothetical protein
MALGLQEVFIPLGSYEPEKLTLTNIKEKTIKLRNGKSQTSYISDWIYTDENGKQGIPCFELGEQLTFGVNTLHPYDMNDADKTPDTVDSLQICYPMTSMETVNDPTEEEKHCIDLFDNLIEKTKAKGIEEASRKTSSMPKNARASFKDESTADEVIKPLYFHSKNPETKQEDTTKPKKSYIKLITYGKGKQMKVNTVFYGPGDKRVNPMKYVDVRGKIHPVVRLEAVTWGSQGTSDYLAFIRMKVLQANYTPTDSVISSKRFLSPNTAPNVEDDDFENETPKLEEEIKK